MDGLQVRFKDITELSRHLFSVVLVARCLSQIEIQREARPSLLLLVHRDPTSASRCLMMQGLGGLLTRTAVHIFVIFFDPSAPQHA